MRNDCVQHITDAQAQFGRNGHGISDPQLIKLVNGRNIPHIVQFIDSQNDRFFSPAEHVGDRSVRIGEAVFGIHQENNDMSQLDGDLGLLSHGF